MYRRTAPLLILAPLVVLLLSPAGVAAQAPSDIDVSLSAGQTELTVGDPVSLTLAVTHSPDDQVIFPGLPATWGAFEVRSQSPTQVAENDDGSLTTSQTIEVTLFVPGEFETPDLLVTVRDASGEVSERAAPPVSLTIASVLVEGDEALRDIRGQAGLSVPPVWPWVVGGVLLVALASLAAYVVVMRRRARLGLMPEGVRDTRPAYQVALDELDRIKGLDLPGQGRLKEHYTLVSECMRTYLEDAYRVPAIDQTTDEIRQGLRATDFGTEPARHAVELLEESDLVKFAKFVPDVRSAREAAVQSRRLVELTKPMPADSAPQVGPALVGEGTT